MQNCWLCLSVGVAIPVIQALVIYSCSTLFHPSVTQSKPVYSFRHEAKMLRTCQINGTECMSEGTRSVSSVCQQP